MKKTIISLLLASAALAIAGCAKHEESGANDANKRYFDAWMQLNYPDAKPTDFGIYILEDEPGSGTEVTKDGFALLDYIATDLYGNIAASTYKETAEQLGTYTQGNYYGAKFQPTSEGAIHAGLLEALVGMQVGGHRKVIIPTWLMSYSSYETEAEYLAEESSNSSAIYDFTVKDFTEDIYKWQRNKIGEYFKENSDIFGDMTAEDTLSGYGGFYYKQIVPPKDTTSFPSDTAIYINYTGKLLDGTVFDTTNERLAKDNGIWSASRKYAPVQVTWAEKFEDITMSSSTLINGFSLTLWQMREFEKGIGVFTSNYGYGYSGSGDNIPGYAPLIFEIEIVKNPDKED